MARARNIKPQYFQNEDLPDIGIEAHFLFAGLWCIADREGRLKDRPRTIKTQVMPYYDVDVDHLLDLLASHPIDEKDKFIIRYQADGEKFIQITNFLKHQNPHIKEAESTIPPYIGPTPEKHHTGTIHEPCKNSLNSDSLNSDSLNSEIENADKVPFRKIADLWNEKCGHLLPRITTVGVNRKRHLRTRWVQLGGSLEAFERLFEMVAASDFLCGITKPDWRATFDWVIEKEENTAKILEGNYVNKSPPASNDPYAGDEYIW